MGFLLHPPTNAEIRRFRDSQRDLPFTYAEVEASRTTAPKGYTIDHNRVLLGTGPDTYAAARSALHRWEMFNVGWLELREPDTPLEVGQVVALVARHYGLYSINAARIVYTEALETGSLCRYGFAYGTLPGHAEIGEERFRIEWDRSDNTVWYDLFAFSRPGPLALLGYPFARFLQLRFARQSLAAMQRAVLSIVK